MRVTKAAAINVRVPAPHNASRYRDLAKIWHKSKGAFRVTGDRYGILRIEGDDQYYVNGRIITFTQISQKSDWIDIDTEHELTPDEAALATQSLGSKRPNKRTHHFVFDLRSHLFLFEMKSTGGAVAGGSIVRFLRRLSETKQAKKEFERVELTLVPDVAMVQQILRSKTLRSIYWKIEPPNPDEGSGAEDRVLDYLYRSNASKIERKLTSVSGESLSLVDEDRELTKVAAKNGLVKAAEYDGQRLSQLATGPGVPLSKSVEYDHKVTSDAEAFRNAAMQVRQEAEWYVKKED